MMEHNPDQRSQEEAGSAELRIPALLQLPEMFGTSLDGNARAVIVNRTHRVVREQAKQMQAQRSHVRDLVLPMLICSALLLMLCHAVWTFLSGPALGLGEAGTELEQEAGKLLNGQTMDTGGPVYLLMMWFLPVSALAFATVFFRRHHGRAGDEVSR